MHPETPDWFREVIATGLARLVAARLNYRPTDKGEMVLTAQEWADGLYNGINPKPSQAPEILKAFGTLAYECVDWPPLGKFTEVWDQVQRAVPHPPDPLALPAPPLSPEKVASIERARENFFKTIRDLPSVCGAGTVRDAAKGIEKKTE